MGKKLRKPRHATTNLGDEIKGKFNEVLAPEIEKWEYKQVSPSTWAFAGPKGELFTRKVAGQPEARAVVEDYERRRSLGQLG